MNASAKDLAKQLERIVEGPGTKSDRARALFRLGLTRSEASELLNMNYSQAHSVWKGMEDGQDQPNGRDRTANRRGQAASSGLLHDNKGTGEAAGLGPAEMGSEHARTRQLNLRPSQTRFVTQDGHTVVWQPGDECRKCGVHLDFSIKWLAFVHSRGADPTAYEDRRPDGSVIKKGKFNARTNRHH